MDGRARRAGNGAGSLGVIAPVTGTKGELYKIGKADMERVTLKSGLPTRLHQQIEKLRKQYGKGNVVGSVAEDLGVVTTKQAKSAENVRLRDYYERTGKVPEGNRKSFKP